MKDRRALLPARAGGLRSGVSWTVAGNAVFAGSQWGILAVFAKLGGAETVGQFSFASAIVTPVFLFLNLQLRSVYAADASQRNTHETYLGLRLLTTMAATLVAGGFALAQPAGTALVVLALAAAKSVDAISDIVYGLAQRRLCLDLIARSLIIRGVSALALAMVAFRVTHSLAAAILGMSAAWLAVLYRHDLTTAAILRKGEILAGSASINQTLRPDYAISRLLPLARTALPLGAVMLLIGLETSVLRIMIAQECGMESLGVFTAMVYLTVAGSVMSTALSQTLMPRLANAIAAADAGSFWNLLRRGIRLNALLGVAGVGIAAVAGAQLLAMLYTSAFVGEQKAFLAIMVAGCMGMLVTLLGAAATALGVYTSQLILHAISLAVIALIARYALPRGGLNGAALAMIGGNLVLLLGYAVMVRRQANRLLKRAGWVGNGDL